MVERSDDWPRCRVCGLPANCLTADLVDPRVLCGDHCWHERHGDRLSAQAAHAVAEGVELYV